MCRCADEEGSCDRHAKLDLAEVVRACRDRLPALTSAQSRAVEAIAVCRTASLGGHANECDHCGHVELSYNSCRHRACPKCQSLEQARWLEAQRATVLPGVEYHHVIFTIPAVLHPIFLGNPAACYGLLFASVSETLQEVAANPDRLGARIGLTTVLHTWTQTLLFHPHVHCIVAGGGLARGEKEWIGCKPGFFLPVRVLSTVFRAKLLEKLQRSFGGESQSMLDQAAKKDWVVYCKPPVAGAEQVLSYLGRYTHRIAISNSRLLSMQDGRVTFTYRDRADGNTPKTMTLDADQFLRRFLLHVLPDGFVRIRHYGFMANCVRREKVALCRSLLGAAAQPVQKPEKPSWQELLLTLTGKDPSACPCCKLGRMVKKYVLPALVAPRPYSGRAKSP